MTWRRTGYRSGERGKTNRRQREWEKDKFLAMQFNEVGSNVSLSRKRLTLTAKRRKLKDRARTIFRWSYIGPHPAQALFACSVEAAGTSEFTSRSTQ